MGTRIVVEDDRTGMSPESLERAFLDHLQFTRAKEPQQATARDAYFALSHAARDRLVYRWMKTRQAHRGQQVKRAYYLSAEYLLGRQLEANLLNLGLLDEAREALSRNGFSLDEVIEMEPDPGLGNGGLGRLAACFMDSMASLRLPGMGYGIRYEFGIFRQEIAGGWQSEQPDDWLKYGNPWEIARPEYTVPVTFGGHTESWSDRDGRFRVRWVADTTVLGVPYDTPVAGFGEDNPTVNTLRLWSAKASEDFDLAVFNDGDYRRAVEQKALSESISKVLYPQDNTLEGKELRLKQQYFFVCCSLHDLLRRFTEEHGEDWEKLPTQAAIQLNDTHPAIAVAELMRILVDRELVAWDEAWEITRRTIAYTNHTLLPEALERWTLDLFGRLLPRHLELIREINRRFLREVHVRFPRDDDRKDRMSIIDEGPYPTVRMANLSIVGSHTVNGVAALHSKLLREYVVRDFAELYPERFTNKTNGVTPRRWVLQANPRLSSLITEKLGGTHWVRDLSQLSQLAEFAEDPVWQERLREVKRANKLDFARWLAATQDEVIDPESLFDVQVKRIHEYKRQLMCCLHAIWLYARIKFHGETDLLPRTVMIGGKAAPGYVEAKHHIKLINDVATVINQDRDVNKILKVVFLRNYNVSYAQKLIPAADLSEQISMAGKEASGTGNMKFQMNGALTIGTLDGANVEIRDAVGAENFFLFGSTVDEVRAAKSAGYRPADAIAGSPALQQCISLLAAGYFNPENPDLHQRIVRYLTEADPYLICADFESYRQTQEAVEADYRAPKTWWSKVARNIAQSGPFSSDRTISEYADEIWGVTPCSVDLASSRR